MPTRTTRRLDWQRFRTGERTKIALIDHPLVTGAAWAVAVFFGLVVVFKAVLPTEIPFGLLLFGIVIGSINALIAVGLILIYRANRIINFAQAEIGIFGAILFENLLRSVGVPWLLALPVGIIASAAMAGFFEYAIIRRFAKAPRLILTVATIGIAQIAVVLTYILDGFFDGQFGSTVETPLTSITVTITNVRFSGDALLLVAVVPVIVIGLNTYLRKTDFGIAVRASAESGDRAALLGVPVKRVSTIMWIVAGGMTGLATMLRSPVVGVISGASLQGPGLLLRALAAAVLARMENIRTAVLAALALGIIEQSLSFAYGGSSISDVVFVVLIIVGLLAQRRSASRAADGGDSTFAAVEEVRRTPKELRDLPIVRWTYRGLAALAALAVVSFPLIASPSKENLAAVIVIYAMVAVSLVVLTGWAGQISLGQFGIVGFGAALSAKMTADYGQDFFVSVVVGALAGASIALVLGVAALRIKGFFFAVTSLGFAVAMQTYFLDSTFFTGLVPENRPERPLLFERFDLEAEGAFFLFCVAMLVVVIVVTRLVRNSRSGRILLAVRDNEKAAQAYGIDHIRAKLMAFAFSGAIAGVAGSLFAVHQHAVQSSAYNPNESLAVFSMVVIGGLGSIPGALMGALFVRGSAYLLPEQFAILATGMGLLFVLLVLPGGLGRFAYDLRDRFLRRVALARDIHVPSLVADRRIDDATETEGDASPAPRPDEARRDEIHVDDALDAAVEREAVLR